MVEKDLGKATILYEDPDEGTVEETVDNEHVAYFQDHWIVKTGEREEGHDIVRRIPAQRVYFVERNVEEFEEEVGTLLNEVQSFAGGIGSEVQTLRDRVGAVTDELRAELRDRTERTEGSDEAAIQINIEEADDGDGGEADDDSDSGGESIEDPDSSSDSNEDRSS